MIEEKTLAILVLTIEGREKSFYALKSEIARQVKKYNLQDDIQLIVCADKKGENTIGYKRNHALQGCNAKFSMFIDDDDIYAHDCLFHLINVLKTYDPDCVYLEGIITENGINPKKFVHSLKYKEYFEENGIYFRPPNHLNAIRTSISKQFKFEEINHGEDTDWAMRICHSGLLKSEAKLPIDEPYYLYQYLSNK
jgi:hypothetical protein